MGKESKIAWCDSTMNWWIGCEELPGRPGCAFCYAHAQGKRCGWDNWGASKSRRITSASNWAQPLKWDAKARAENRVDRVFVMSLGDFLEDRPELVEPRKRAREIMRETTNLEWLILTKRIDNAGLLGCDFGNWPTNVRLGITVENQDVADRDVPKLLALDIPNFISVEPQLGPVDFFGTSHEPGIGWHKHAVQRQADYGTGTEWDVDLQCGIDWIICGAESRGKYAGRPFSDDWARSLRDQCQSAGIPFCFKQGHANGETVELPELDGRVWNERPETRKP